MSELVTLAAFYAPRNCAFRCLVIVLATPVARTLARRLASILKVLLSALSDWLFSHGPDVFAAESIHVEFFFFGSSAVVSKLLNVFQG